jgi:arylsulfatase
MFSIMDFLPTFAHAIGASMPTDPPIDGVDQTDVLLGQSAMGHREGLLTFIGADLVAVRWKQWRAYMTDVHPTGIGPQPQVGMVSASAPMAGYPKIFNIEMDLHEDLALTETYAEEQGPTEVHEPSATPEHVVAKPGRTAFRSVEKVPLWTQCPQRDWL